jgi:hypothetical protein
MPVQRSLSSLFTRTRCIAIVALITFASGCPGSRPTLVTPVIGGAFRGTQRIDIYGQWTKIHDPLGSTPKTWQYRYRYVPSGTEVYDDGTTNGMVLQPFDAGVVTWTITTGPAQIQTTPAASTQPDTQGYASATLAPQPSGRGTAILTVKLDYGGTLTSEDAMFEVDSSVP